MGRPFDFLGGEGTLFKSARARVRGGVFPYILTINYGHVCTAVKGMVLQPFCPGGGGYLGQVLLGMCHWPLRTPTPL